MEYLKILLLLLAYSAGIATLVLQVVCYLKGFEYKETIFFTIAFLLLIVASTLHIFIDANNIAVSKQLNFVTNITTIIFSVAIPVNIHKERLGTKRKTKNSVVLGLALFVIMLVILLKLKNMQILQLIVVGAHLFFSVVYSMFYVLLTKPGLLIKQREFAERKTAIFILSIMVVAIIVITVYYNKIPLILLHQNGGIILAVVCIILSVSKIPGDIKKLLPNQTVYLSNLNNIAGFGITPRETEVLKLLITGKAYKQIAEQLCISLPTVKTHVSNIYSKTNVRNRLELSNLVK